MIIGIGNDITDIRRIEKSLTRFGERFERKVFTEIEQKKANSRKNAGLKIMASTYAKRFAAKEACAKALGTGIGFGVGWKDMEVSNLASGQPVITLFNDAKKIAETLTPAGKTLKILLTLTDEYPLAQALVILSAE